MRTLQLSSALFATIALAATEALALDLPTPATCGSLQESAGPADYRLSSGTPFRVIVESAHFPPHVEALKRGNSTDDLGGDIDYTLRAFPNHHRALVAMMNLSLRKKTNQPAGARWPLLCYFERAIRYAPDDGTVRLLLGVYLLKQGNRQDAADQLEKAIAMIGDNANAHYNLGLAYADLADYDKASTHARKAYALGFPLPGLRNRLEKAGKWPTNASETGAAGKSIPLGGSGSE